MYRYFKILYILCLYILFQSCIFQPVFGQYNKINFTNYSEKEGLNRGSISDICQDKYGFIWIATTDGLLKFDGKDFQFYELKSDSFPEIVSLVNSLFIDSEDKLWITSGPGIFQFIEKTGKFEHYYHIENDSKSLSNNSVESITEDKKGNLYFGNWCGISIFDKKTKSFKNINLREKANQRTRVRDLCVDDKGIIWAVSRNGGLYSYNTNTEEINNIIIHSYITPVSLMVYLTSVQYDGKYVWLGSFGDGLIKYYPDNGKIEKYHFYVEPSELSASASNQANEIKDIFIDSDNNFWIATEKCLFLFNKKTGKYTSFLNDNKNYGISFNCIEEDNNKGMWLGSVDQGLFYFNLRQKHFHLYEYTSEKRSVEMEKIKEFYPLDNNKYIVETFEGIKTWDLTTNNITEISGFQDFYILYHDKNKRFWVANNKSIYVSKTNNPLLVKQVFRDSTISKSYFNKKTAFSIAEDTSGTIWLSANNYIINFDVENGIVRHCNTKVMTNQQADIYFDRIGNMFFDKQNNLWYNIKAKEMCVNDVYIKCNATC